jgi:hypothetical protein
MWRSPDRDSKRLHYRNLLGVYVKASNYDSCRDSKGVMLFGPCALAVPFVTLYRPVAGAELMNVKSIDSYK